MAVFTPAPKTQGSYNLPGEQQSGSLHRSGVMLRSHRSNSLCIARHLQLVRIFYFFQWMQDGLGISLKHFWRISDTNKRLKYLWYKWILLAWEFKWRVLQMKTTISLINLWVLVTFMCKRIWLYVTDMTCWGFPNWRVYKHVAVISLFIPIISISI